jgi:hypothetical protein
LLMSSIPSPVLANFSFMSRCFHLVWSFRRFRLKKKKLAIIWHSCLLSIGASCCG